MLNRSALSVTANAGRHQKGSGGAGVCLSRVLAIACADSPLIKVRSVSTSTPSKISQQQVAASRKSSAAAAELDQSGPQQQPKSNTSSNEQEAYQARLQNLNLWHSVDTIKRLGHRMAQLDPLRLRQPASLKDLATWSYPLIERLRTLDGGSETVATRGFLDSKQPLMTVNELLETVVNIYANSECGLEFAHLSSSQEVEWLTSQWEKLNENFHLSPVEQHNLAKLLLECEAFDHFMGAKFPTTKRYGCEGAESMLVVFDEILRLCHLTSSPESGTHLAASRDLDEQLTRSIGRIDDVIIGMPHRGRLNLLACLLGFDAAAIFSKTRGECELDLRDAWMGTGDGLSHLSTNVRFVYGLKQAEIGLSRDTPDPINVSLLPNPSHLEVAAPMVAGSARGRAHNLHHNYSSSPKFVSLLRPDTNTKPASDYQRHLSRVLPIQVHGDASVSGQGIVSETLQMANLPAFSVGGSLHLVVNNQIGYTTDPTTGRSSRYCTDVFKLIEAPIIHVNGQNISSLIRATRLALAYRQKFGKDIAIDLVCYRQHGHNEMDEPSFTQPLMYQTIRNRRSIPQIYCDSIGMSEQQRAEIVDSFKAQQLQPAFKRADSYKPDNDNYRNFNLAREYHRDHITSWQTGFQLELLRSIALASVQVPQHFEVHPNLKRVLIEERLKRFNLAQPLEQIKVDWATAEILAFGSLLRQNNSIRLSGQDVARGTFSTRHVALFDQRTERAHIPLNEMMSSDSTSADDQQPAAKLEVANTILSEEAALAYEFGYSIETCQLSLWEAQFGDFFNTAQSIIDTLISSSESKWLKQSALTLLLPHGLDGAGPEHSSGHLERFLQMSNSSLDSIDTEARLNWSICFPTKPSQYFHLLRRQVLRPFRKPLVVASPKTIFRHPDCVSELADFGPDRQFEPVLDDPRSSDFVAAASGPRRRGLVDTVVLCSGKIYFALDEIRCKHAIDNVALVRIEELCPFPVQSIVNVLKKYPNLNTTTSSNGSNIVWFQEEHKNQGAYTFVEARLRNILGLRALKYIGRSESELPATGSPALHKKEYEQLVRQFVELKK